MVAIYARNGGLRLFVVAAIGFNCMLADAVDIGLVPSSAFSSDIQVREIRKAKRITNDEKFHLEKNATLAQTNDWSNVLRASRDLFTNVFIPSERVDSAQTEAILPSAPRGYAGDDSLVTPSIRWQENGLFKTVRPSYEDMPITKRPEAAFSLATLGLSETSVPGPMTSVPLYLLDVTLMPTENSLAVMVLGTRNYPAVGQEVRATLEKSDPRALLAEMPVALHWQDLHNGDVGTEETMLSELQGKETLKCTILDPAVVDSNCVGGSHILLCRFASAGLDELVQRKRGKMMTLQLGNELVKVSTRTLSAGNSGYTISRHYTASLAGDRLRASVVVPSFGTVAPYWNETLDYYKVSGISHVYVGVYQEEPPGGTRKILDNYISDGFVSLLELDAWEHLDWDELFSTARTREKYQPPEPVISLINDWALYHAKSFDDLLVVSDYDEFMVPTSGKLLPDVISDIARKQRLPKQSSKVYGPSTFGGRLRPLSLLSGTQALTASSGTTAMFESLRDHVHNFCFFLMCPVVTYGDQDRDAATKRTEPDFRGRVSRAVDFPYMDGGQHDFKQPQHDSRTPDGMAFCEQEAGHANIYPKSVIVVRTVYKTSVHVPGACSAVFLKNSTNGEDKAGPYVRVWRRDGVVVQHFTEMRHTGRYVEHVESHIQAPSYYNTIWAPRVKHSYFPSKKDVGATYDNGLKKNKNMTRKALMRAYP
eukprot:TRINITY_DN49069_c0_g1_i1.p1 TRINITY_DN49069_c0_g1~~TRINITY_DN49069_c0_g1_i1.p1  ORF type:complete len:708 (-),score=82.74 TRINITY_DN49069_c0_g1_i1:215-2338(-)